MVISLLRKLSRNYKSMKKDIETIKKGKSEIRIQYLTSIIHWKE